MTHPIDDSRPRAGLGAALILVAPALLIGAGWLLWASNPALLARILAPADTAFRYAGTMLLLGIVPAVAIVLLVWPPAWPLVRRAAETWRAKLSFDRKAARDHLQRLGEFENARDLQGLGQLYVNSRQPRAAIAPLARAIELEPDNARSHYLVARAFLQLGAAAEALKAARHAIAIDPDLMFGEGLLLAAELELRAGDSTQALELARSHEQRYGESIRGLYVAARAAWRNGDKESCAKDIARLLEIPPSRGTSYGAEEALARARARVARIRGGEP